jgi:hypothetical protein
MFGIGNRRVWLAELVGQQKGEVEVGDIDFGLCGDVAYIVFRLAGEYHFFHLASRGEGRLHHGHLIEYQPQGHLGEPAHLSFHTVTYQLDESKADPDLQLLQPSTTLDQRIKLIRAHLPPIKTQIPHLAPFLTFHDRLEQSWRYRF